MYDAISASVSRTEAFLRGKKKRRGAICWRMRNIFRKRPGQFFGIKKYPSNILRLSLVHMYNTNWTSMSACASGPYIPWVFLLDSGTSLNDRASQCFPDYIFRPCRRTVESRIDSLSKSKLWIAMSDSSENSSTHFDNPAIV